MDRLHPIHRNLYKSDFNLADEAFCAGRVAAHTTNRTSHWTHWCTYVQPLGVDPFLQQSSYTEQVRLLSGFAARNRSGAYGRGRQVKAGSVSSALTVIGQTIALEFGTSPLKLPGSDRMVPRIQQMLDGWRKANPATLKQLPVEANVPEYMAELGTHASSSSLDCAIGDLALIAIYYLLRIGEYMSKG